jgi:ADP-heptose:LPS heptosyltransferase
MENILVVSNTGLGDTILSTPAIKTLRCSFPNTHITLLVHYKLFPLFDTFEYVDNVLHYKNNILNLVKNILIFRKQKIDTIFLMHSNGPQDIFLSLMSNAKNILKMTHNQNHEFKNIFLNKPVTKIQHDSESRIDLVRIFNPQIIDYTMEVPKKFYQHHKYFSNKGLYIGLQIGAADEYKMWDIQNFIKLSTKLHTLNNVIIVILGASKLEKSLANKLMSNIHIKNRAINLCGNIKIQELPNIIDSLDLLITNDTGTLHLAIAMRTPTISLFGPTNEKIFGPNQDLELHTVIKKHEYVDSSSFNKKQWRNGMNNISVNEVFLESSKILKRLI